MYLILILFLRCVTAQYAEEGCQETRKYLDATLKPNLKSFKIPTDGYTVANHEGSVFEVTICNTPLRQSAGCYKTYIGTLLVDVSADLAESMNKTGYLNIAVFRYKIYMETEVNEQKGLFEKYYYTCDGGVVRKRVQFIGASCKIDFTESGVRLQANIDVPFYIETKSKTIGGIVRDDENFPVKDEKTPLNVVCANTFKYTMMIKTQNLACIGRLVFFHIPPKFQSLYVCSMPITFTSIFYLSIIFTCVSAIAWFGGLWVLYPVLYPFIKVTCTLLDR